MTTLTSYHAIVTDIEQWNADAAELAGKLHLMQVRRQQMIDSARDLKMPVRMVSESLVWPISPVLGVTTVEAFRDAVKVALGNFGGDLECPETDDRMAEEVLRQAMRFGLPAPEDVAGIVEALKPRSTDTQMVPAALSATFAEPQGGA